MKILLTGATGLTGSLSLEKLLNDPVVSLVEIWTRKKSHLEHPKLRQQQIDFDNILNYEPEGFDAYVCCLGSTIKKSGTKERFRQADFDYVTNFAKLAEKKKAGKFIVISSVGANSNSRNFYLRTKGEMEETVSKYKIPIITILRPSLLMGNRNEHRTGEKFAQVMMKFFNHLMLGKLKRYRGIKADTVADAIVTLVKSESQGIRVIESENIALL